jgi:acyl-CoA hydrolase
MEWIDVVAAVVARRHSGMNVTTACVDSLDFTSAAYANDTLVLVGYMTYTGNTSMEICVKTYVEALDGSRTLINKAYVVMVALDENEKPSKVPQLVCESAEEKAEWQKASKRNAERTGNSYCPYVRPVQNVFYRSFRRRDLSAHFRCLRNTEKKSTSYSHRKENDHPGY